MSGACSTSTGMTLANSRGAAAVEFALVTPIAFLLLFLIVVGGAGMEQLGKVYLAARTAANLVSMQNTVVAASQVQCILAASGTVMAPYSTVSLSLTVSEILVTGYETGSVVWSQAAYGGSPLAAGSSIAVPAGAFSVGSYQILAQASYTFTPPLISTSLLPAWPLKAQQYAPTRLTASISLTSN